MLPFFPPICWVRTDCFLRQGRFDHRPVDALPSPGDPLHLVVFSQPFTPESNEHLLALPLPKVLVDGTGAAKPFLRQRLPLASGAEYVYDSLEYLARVERLAASTRLAPILPPLLAFPRRNQRLNLRPHRFGHRPGLDCAHARKWCHNGGQKANYYLRISSNKAVTLRRVAAPRFTAAVGT